MGPHAFVVLTAEVIAIIRPPTSRGCAITFSSHILEAYKIAMRAGGIKVESGTGVGKDSSENL